MVTRNRCYTYFAITGDFDPDEITRRLALKLDKSWKTGDRRRDGVTTYTFSAWYFGRCDAYDVITENQMRKTIADLLDKIDELNKIREEYDVVFELRAVPEIYVGDANPALGPSLDVIDFCSATRTGIDIDMYVYGEDED